MGTVLTIAVSLGVGYIVGYKFGRIDERYFGAIERYDKAVMMFSQTAREDDE